MAKNAFKRFTKHIVPNNEINSCLVFQYNRRKKLRVNAKIEIPTGFNVVIATNRKTHDLLSAGVHKINASTMPGVFDKQKLGVPTKRGIYAKKFVAQAYYVNLKMLSHFEFVSNDPFYIKSEQFGRVKGYAEGVCNLQVKDSDALMEHLLKHASGLSVKKITQEISAVVGNCVNQLVEKSKIEFTDVLLEPQGLNAYLAANLNDALAGYGLTCDNPELVSVKITKKMQKKVNQFLVNRGTYSPKAKTGAGNALLDSFNNVELPGHNANVAPQQGDIFQSSANAHDNPYAPNQVQVEKFQPVVGYGNANQSAYGQEAAPQSSSHTITTQSESSAEASVFTRRMAQVQNLAESTTPHGGPKIETNFNAQDIIGGAMGAKKQCKFCGQTIDNYHSYCPKCGFKQA